MAKTPAPKPSAPVPDDPYLALLAKDHSDAKRTRRALAVAAALHVAAFFVVFPQGTTEAQPPPPPEKIYVVKPIRFKPPKPEPPKPPQERAKRIPIPDPTPDEPEPLVLDTPEPDLDVLDDDVPFAIPDAPPAPPAPPAPEVVRAGGQVPKPKQLVHVDPVYTELARRARVEGTVIVDALIGEDGRVIEVTALKSLRMGLTDEALRAIKQWRYEPPKLNGKPVKVMMVVTVHFAIQ